MSSQQQRPIPVLSVDWKKLDNIAAQMRDGNPTPEARAQYHALPADQLAVVQAMMQHNQI